jgi:hypothetical protein
VPCTLIQKFSLFTRCSRFSAQALFADWERWPKGGRGLKSGRADVTLEI